VSTHNGEWIGKSKITHHTGRNKEKRLRLEKDK